MDLMDNNYLYIVTLMGYLQRTIWMTRREKASKAAGCLNCYNIACYRKTCCFSFVLRAIFLGFFFYINTHLGEYYELG